MIEREQNFGKYRPNIDMISRTPVMKVKMELSPPRVVLSPKISPFKADLKSEFMNQREIPEDYN